MKRLFSILFAMTVAFALTSCTIEKKELSTSTQEDDKNKIEISESYKGRKIASNSNSQMLMTNINYMMPKEIEKPEETISIEDLEKFYFYFNQKENYVSYEVLSTSVGFGGHMDFELNYYVLDTKNKKLVDEEMLFKNKEEAIDFIVTEMAQNSLERADEISLYNIQMLQGHYSVDDARAVFLMLGESDLNFALTDEGMLISYMPYEIAPYVMGQIDFVIPYEKLKPYLKETIIKNLGI